MRFDESHHAIGHGLGRISADSHLGQLVLNHAEFGDGLAEGLTLLGVLEANRQHVLGATHGAGTELQPADVEDVESDNVAAPDLAEHVFHGHGHVVEIHSHRGAALDAHLFFFGAGRDAGKFTLDQECGELLAADFGEDRKQIGRAAVGDPHFLAVEDVVFAIRTEVGAGAGGQRVGTGVRLGEAVSAQHFHLGQFGQVMLLLFLGAEIQNGQRADAHVRAVPAG